MECYAQMKLEGNGINIPNKTECISTTKGRDSWYAKSKKGRKGEKDTKDGSKIRYHSTTPKMNVRE